jgi:hypothetical protein
LTDIRANDGAGFATDESLAYARSRRRFVTGERLLFDEPYRYAHLPLLDPGHAAVINAPNRLDYEAGRYKAERYSLVVPVPHSLLGDRPIFRAIDDTLRRSSFAGKICFDLCETRRAIQHITVAGGFEAGDLARIEATIRERLQEKVSVAYQLKGPFIGAKNYGRMYFPAYPAVHAGGEAYATLQDAIGMRPSGFYAMGYYNFADELTCEETEELQGVIDEFASQIVLEADPDEFWIMATNDDLVLSGRVLTRIATENASRRVSPVTRPPTR